MTGQGKLLKIACIAALFAGIASVVLGVVLLVGSAVGLDVDALATACEGALSTVFGVRCAILANVPSNTAKIRSKALLVTLVGIAVLAFCVYAVQQVTVAQLAMAALTCGLFVMALVVSHTIVKEQMRK